MSAYKGTGWVATLTDPVATALYSWETQKLDKWINDIYQVIPPQSATSSGTANTNGSADKLKNNIPGGVGKP